MLHSKSNYQLIKLNFMKLKFLKYSSSILAIILALIGCNKPSDTIKRTEDFTFKVTEVETGKPIENVNLELDTCKDVSYNSCSLYRSGVTNNKGECTFTMPKYINSIVIATHPDYFKTGTEGLGSISMIPNAWQKISLKRQNNYPVNTRLTLTSYTSDGIFNPFFNLITINGPFRGIDFYSQLTINIPVSIDTIVYLRSLGSYHDYTSWALYPDTSLVTIKEGQTDAQLINRFDTANTEINY
jgi:hypothetical protein